MDNSRLLYDAFNNYYETGMRAFENNNFEIARRNLLSAAEAMLKMAKGSPSPLKEKRIKRADELLLLANKMEKKLNRKETSSVGDDVEKLSKGANVSSKEEQSKAFSPVAKPNITLDDVAGLEIVKEEIKRKIIDPQRYPEVYKTYKKKNGGGILLYGAPGTGKTMIAQAIAGEIDAKFFAIKCSDIVSKWFGEAELNIKKLFEEAKSHPCSIIFFDEFEALGAKRDTNSTVMKRIIPELLAQMQGFEKNDNTLLIIAATNRPWDIDSAFLRSGRLSTHIYVPLPDEEARKVIIEKQLKGIPLSKDVDLDEMVDLTNGFNGADVVEFCDRLKDDPIERAISTGQMSEITAEDVRKTATRVKSSVNKDDLQKIRKYEEKS